jgi:hypothetical protein
MTSRSVMTKILPFSSALTVVLSGCSMAGGQPEVTACEEFIKSALRSPSTFKSVSSKSSDSKSGDGKGVREIFIEYDAANAFGTPIRGSQICTFDLVDGKVLNPDVAVTFAKSDRVLGMGDGSCCQTKAPTSENSAMDPKADSLDLMPDKAGPVRAVADPADAVADPEDAVADPEMSDESSQ